MNNFLNGMFGKVGSGMCRLSMNGGIAVKTNGGYKTYNGSIIPLAVGIIVAEVGGVLEELVDER